MISHPIEASLDYTNMANPQKENGYTGIANEILENLAKFRIPGEAGQILFVIIRQTYGYQKKEDRISISQFCEKTGLKKSNVCRAIAKLVKMNIVIQKNYGCKSIKGYSINKDYEKWSKVLQKDISLISKEITNCTPKGDIQKKEIYIREAIDSFKLINSDYKSLFKIPLQRNAVSELIERYGFEKVLKAVYLAKFSFTNQYFPHFITPNELKIKWSKVVKFYASRASDRLYVASFEEYMAGMEKDRTKNILTKKQVIDTQIGGQKVSLVFNVIQQ